MQIAKTEQRMLLIATLTIPIFVIFWYLFFIGKGIYDFLFPPQTNFAIDDWGGVPTFPILKLTAFLGLTISAFFIYRQKIFASLMSFLLPISGIMLCVSFIYQRVAEILANAKDAETIKFYTQTSLAYLFLDNLDNVNLFILIFVFVLLLWQISILLRMLIYKSQRKMDLP